MCQNLMILARLGDLRTQFDLGVLPPLVLRCSSGLSRAPGSYLRSQTFQTLAAKNTTPNLALWPDCGDFCGDHTSKLCALLLI
jgi:hypothetical protein